MGFYGNITNNAKTQFQFDKIYPNRYQLDKLAKSDDIYIGRYVLIEYDSENSYQKDDFLRIWVDSQGYGYQDANKTLALTSGTCKVGDMFIVSEDDLLINLEEVYNSIHYIYKVIEATSTYAKLEKVTGSLDTNYTKNYNIDINNYGQGRGYDSTVWQKVYVENTEKYVMIAELNSVVPTFDVVADAPTLAPLAPHFDTSSTDVYYKLHWQPTWGLRVAQASGAPSDENVIHSSINKDTFEETTTSVAGQIYYNKNGFNPDVRTHNSSIENSIKVTPTGKSGEKYYNHKTGQMTVQNDIQEISINLPAIGNAVSDFWDVMYGQVRNKDIDWNSYAGLRLVGNQESGGFSYNTKNVSTVAGAINSVHDLMGMIIESGNLDNRDDKNYINITNASTAKIYYNEENDRYYRKSINYSYEEADVDYRLVIVTEETYAPGLYYTKDASGNYIPALGIFNPGEYYEKYLLNNNSVYSKTNELIDYAPNTFYALENQDYILSGEDTFELGRNYYKVSLDNLRSVIPYEQYKYYRKDDAGKWISDESYVINQNYYTIQSNNSNELYAYVPNAWLYLKNGQTPTIDDGLEITLGREYYHWDIKQDEQGNITFEVQGQPVNVVAYNKNIHFQYDKDAKTYNPILDELTVENCRTSEFQFCEIALNLIEDEFYVKDKYYYLDNITKNILFDTSNKYTENREYYYPTVQQVYFYREYYYYYIDDTTQEYVLDGNNKVTAGRIYYEKNPYYIISDTSRVFEAGAPWNSNITRIPCAITLGIRTVDYEWKELEGFARDLNTIHGLILKINQIVEWNNNEIRDLKTVQGCINTINDLVDKINDLIPGQFVITNAYGQLSPASWTTDNWLQVKVNEETNNIDFQHIGPVETGTETNFNINANNNEISSIKFQTFGYDARGHIYNQTDEEIEFSTDEWIQIDGSTENHSHTIDIYHTGPVGAAESFSASQTEFSIAKGTDTTDAAITLQALSYDDKGHINEQIDENILISTDAWLEVIGSTKTEEDGERVHSLSFEHTGPIGAAEDFVANGTSFAISSSEEEINNINFQTFNYDDKGHVYNQINEGISVSTDDWIKISGKTDGHNHNIKVEHDIPVATTPINSESDTLDFGESFKIPLLSWDGKGHIYSASNSDRTLTLPTPSLNDFTADGHSVLTGISMTPETGAIVQTNAEVGSLKLNNYTQATKDTITQDDSIYTAFYKLSNRAQILEGRVKDHENKLDNLIGGELKETFDTLVEMSEWLDSNDTELIESINKEIQNREAADKKHTDDIASNLAAIEVLQTNKYDINTQFDWGYTKSQTEEYEVSRIDNGDGTTTVIYESTISYEPYTASLQSILNEIRDALGLRLKGEDEGVVTREEIIPTPNPDEELET